LPPAVEDTPATETIVPDARPEPESEPFLLGTADILWRFSALYRFLMPYLRDIAPVLQTLGPTGILGGEAVIRADNPTVPIPFYVYRTPPDEEFEAAWQLTEQIITGLRDEVSGRDTRFMVLLIAAPEQVYPQAWENITLTYPELSGPEFDPNAPNRRLAAFLTAEEIPYIDLLPVFQEFAAQPDAPPLHLRHDQHWTAAGHRLAAETIHTFLEGTP
jgi:hypothetical protein